ncbi:MAG: galactose ABC transporter substrate-binding protein [Agathobacter sp.]|nr:galactose ABC transporter substrate-binding protein [Agathobacter sp.]
MGCGASESDDQNEIYVGIACYDQGDIFISNLIQCFKDELNSQKGDSYDVMVTVRDAVGSQKTQNDQVKEMIDEGCNILCINLVDRTDPSEIIDSAKEKNIPIIFFNREPVAEDMMQWDKLYYVGAKARQSGQMQGEIAADLILKDKSIDKNHDGKIQYVVLEGEMGHQDAIVRTDSSVETILAKGIKMEKLSYEIANWKRAQAQNRMEQLIRQYGNTIELVLSNNDDMALGALDSYRLMGYTKNDMPMMLGVDGMQEALEAVKDGCLTGTVYNDKEGQAQIMAAIVFASVSGKGLDGINFENLTEVYLPYQKVTIDNVDNYLEANEGNVTP